MLRRQLSDIEKRDWLRLGRSENVSSLAFRQLIRRFGTPTAALEALPEMALRGGKKNIKLYATEKADEEMSKAGFLKVSLIAWGEPLYPEALAASEDAPPLIMARGNLKYLSKPGIGIAGVANPSSGAKKLAEYLASELGQQNLTIVAGLSGGIENVAHDAALKTGTIAVLTSGADVAPNARAKVLYDNIIEQGCVLSVNPLGAKSASRTKPKRDRLLSALCLGILVIEARSDDDALVMARVALEQGREVFAVPGSPLDARSAGSNDLLRHGAVLTEKAADILAHLQGLPNRFNEAPANDFEAPSTPVEEKILDAARTEILDSLLTSPVSVDEISRHCHLTPSVTLTVLLELELAGRIRRFPGHKVALIA